MTQKPKSILELLYELQSRIEQNPNQQMLVIKRFCEERARMGDMETGHIVLLTREMFSKISSLPPGLTVNINTIDGDLNMPDSIHIHDVVGPVNVKSRLDRVTQTVNNAQSLQADSRAELSKLLEELQTALAPAESHQPQDVERVVKTAEMVADEVAKEKPSKAFLGITLAGLAEAAKSVQDIAPAVLDAANRIAHFVSGLF